jgi:uncharacterized membrane protein
MKKTFIMRRMLQGFIAAMFILVVMTPACSSDSEDEIDPDCNLENVTYSATIAPIMVANCNSCHSGASASAGIITATYEGLRIIALSGQLMGVVNHDSGFSPMPQGQPKLGQCPRDQIASWVNDGAMAN